ncbi:hypothetical protein PR048_025918 [Dryococelus australis]|uniref:Kazal-like domain-containing protein n=1 Tax=Dryococelus australis TaxID=614101 RepID=A0ABQ9GJX5_9NEOP|nr:hypothetical protein PR048_025918 [Dryococelus australis]
MQLTDFVNDCNYNCGCKDTNYQPVCFAEREMTFFSPCHIGCQDTYLDSNISKTVSHHPVGFGRDSITFMKEITIF